MTVSDIVELSKTKVKIFLDGEFAFVLYKGELRNLGIKQNTELSEITYNEITRVLLPKRAKLRCMNLLQSRDYTRHQLMDKLREGLYSDGIIQEAIAYVESYGYIDDMRYSKSYINDCSGRKSRKQIEMDLLKKGVSKDVIFDAFESMEESQELIDEEDLIRRLLAKKHYDPSNTTREERQKLIGFLYRKGFSLDKIYKSLGEQTDD